MTKRPSLIIFTGMSATGKTSLSEKVSEELAIPLCAKDAIKEIMFDELDWSDQEWAGKVARTALNIIQHVTKQQLRAGKSIIVESNYMPRLASKGFQDIQNQYACQVVQVVCRAELDVLAQRFYDRNISNRHTGLQDNSSVDDLKRDFERRIVNGEDQPLDLESEVIIVDTTDFATVDVSALCSQIKQKLG